MDNKEIEQRMQELKEKEEYIEKNVKEACKLREEVRKEIQENMELLEQIKREKRANRKAAADLSEKNLKREWQTKVMLVLAGIIVMACVFAAGMAIGRCLAFLSAFGC